MGFLNYNEAPEETVQVTGQASLEDEGNGWEWAIVEIFGHRKHAGRTREEERFGTKMLRIDVPNKGDPATHGWTTHYYGGSAIFSYSLTDESSAMRANKPYEPPARYSLPAPDDDDERELIDEDDRPF
ncbi:hypothetical protein [Microvirga massiliensis]|uniref:hypothetical protein n=1 Tax=Microvirga massiliensis TaxID=1033741 RepID=UPI000660349F|nr:hypothetical protein [Microvirga massiliensis]